MLEILRDHWHADLPFAELIELREELGNDAPPDSG
jgi:4-diphosphocytidyl-2C-methyl-D-erythritol kinase